MKREKMKVIATSKDLSDENIEKIIFRSDPLGIEISLKDGRTLYIVKEKDNNGNPCLVFYTLFLNKDKPPDIEKEYLVGRMIKRIKGSGPLPSNALRFLLNSC